MESKSLNNLEHFCQSLQAGVFAVISVVTNSPALAWVLLTLTEEQYSFLEIKNSIFSNRISYLHTKIIHSGFVACLLLKPPSVGGQQLVAHAFAFFLYLPAIY